MSIPTFNAQALVSRAGRDMPSCRRVRFHAVSMPGIDGLYVQPHGSAQREITVQGILEAQGASAALAHQQLKSDLRDKQAMADGQTVSTYVGTDGARSRGVACRNEVPGKAAPGSGKEGQECNRHESRKAIGNSSARRAAGPASLRECNSV